MLVLPEPEGLHQVAEAIAESRRGRRMMPISLPHPEGGDRS
jgi:hypothetical protein